ncbi:fungal-specific transcription factor domain-containing protein [Exophiala viscosa]|uniref:Fungal-specific transcription factor domain-containing protein n=1 Tax=Exophiala viscosa TaxID=2486360 RepID=A0AAN6IAQ2_9EURO|nr:fungal-specific transcription factor domain-containing protein [Exophiala viscosa]
MKKNPHVGNVDNVDRDASIPLAQDSAQWTILNHSPPMIQEPSKSSSRVGIVDNQPLEDWTASPLGHEVRADLECFAGPQQSSAEFLSAEQDLAKLDHSSSARVGSGSEFETDKASCVYAHDGNRNEISLNQNEREEQEERDLVQDAGSDSDSDVNELVVQLAMNFKHVSGSIPAHDRKDNPYRKSCLIAVSYPTLLHTIIAVATDHMYNYGRSSIDLTTSRHSRALKSLQESLKVLAQTEEKPKSNDSVIGDSGNYSYAYSVLSPRDVVLAAILMQIVSNVMTGSDSAEAHMRIAAHFLREMGLLYQPGQSFFPRLLVQRFAMVDVVLSFLRHRDPLAPPDFILYQPNQHFDLSEPSFREMTGISFLNGRVMSGMTPDIFAEAYLLESEMRVWGRKYHENLQGKQECLLAIPPPDSQNSDRNLDVLGECFYWTGHLLLMRRVLLDPTTAPRVQMVRNHLFRLIDCLPTGCRPDSSVPFPFYMAAREAISADQRAWVRNKHAIMRKVYRDRARDLMMASIEEIWAKADSSASSHTEVDHIRTEGRIKEIDRRSSHFMF